MPESRGFGVPRRNRNRRTGSLRRRHGDRLRQAAQGVPPGAIGGVRPGVGSFGFIDVTDVATVLAVAYLNSRGVRHLRSIRSPVPGYVRLQFKFGMTTGLVQHSARDDPILPERPPAPTWEEMQERERQRGRAVVWLDGSPDGSHQGTSDSAYRLVGPGPKWTSKLNTETANANAERPGYFLPGRSCMSAARGLRRQEDTLARESAAPMTYSRSTSEVRHAPAGNDSPESSLRAPPHAPDPSAREAVQAGTCSPDETRTRPH
jgi:hypothetical protein